MSGYPASFREEQASVLFFFVLMKSIWAMVRVNKAAVWTGEWEYR